MIGLSTAFTEKWKILKRKQPLKQQRSRKRTDLFTKRASQRAALRNSGRKHKPVLGKWGIENRNKMSGLHKTPFGFDPHELCYCERSAWAWTGKLWKEEKSQELSMWQRDSEESESFTLKLEGGKQCE